MYRSNAPLDEMCCRSEQKIVSCRLTRTSDLVTPRLQLALMYFSALLHVFGFAQPKVMYFTHILPRQALTYLFSFVSLYSGSVGSVPGLRRMNSATIFLAPVYLYEMTTHCTRCSLEVGSCDCGESDHL